ncbi:putative plastid-lipid-associated protein 12, chloroplastic [Zostera marina]|uniref:Putative plastid-lipid-associated protein 12, chloroplastic n=1 Tax=Zostera marina TaxID=29655 RepID=A0A0K9NMM3_ZOSMR|nr:putative plastid-lipid-associated protein 12, chloroplastic [Zostera marina]
MTTVALRLGFPLPLCSTSHNKRSFFQRNQLRYRPISSSLSLTEPEVQLVDGILGIQGRGRSATPKQLKDVELAVRTLEKLGGVPDPTRSSLIQGRWKLIFTTRPGTASPIQRTFVGVDVFTIFQEIFLDTSYPRVSNIVQFSDKVGNLKVEAEATVKDGNRILFRFDQAAFSFKFLPFKVPYPVPFRLLGDEAKGWLDTTYLSTTGNIRISRGNKGTTFVLQKKIEPRQQLLSAISTSRGIEENKDKLIAIRQKEEGKGFEMKEGKWQLLWSSKMAVERGSLSEMANVGSVKGLQIIKKNGEFENVYNSYSLV